MSDLELFKRHFESSKPALRVWGQHIVDAVQLKVKELKGVLAPSFIKISSEPRVKALSSALEKIERKNYQNPLTDMTDLVGVRFVVLTNDDLQELADIIESFDWRLIISKDFSVEISEAPKVFDYQSKHYEIRPNSDVEVNGIEVSSEICCEVQIRTLMQHAYAELVHDNIYKADGAVPPSAMRFVSRSMALMETTDDLFCRTLGELRKENKSIEDIIRNLELVYVEEVGSQFMEADRALHFDVLSSFEEYLHKFSYEQAKTLLCDKAFIKLYISERAPTQALFRQPIVIFLYWFLANFDSAKFREKWRYGFFNKEAGYVASDLGLSLDFRGG